jgi:hypothetical protein
MHAVVVNVTVKDPQAAIVGWAASRADRVEARQVVAGDGATEVGADVV